VCALSAVFCRHASLALSSGNDVFVLFADGDGDALHGHSFPTRRSSDLHEPHRWLPTVPEIFRDRRFRTGCRCGTGSRPCDAQHPDRKSTRLNSSHVSISYAAFCLKKKTMTLTMGSTSNAIGTTSTRYER